jgi:hypothetical protein
MHGMMNIKIKDYCTVSPAAPVPKVNYFIVKEFYWELGN